MLRFKDTCGRPCGSRARRGHDIGEDRWDNARSPRWSASSWAATATGTSCATRPTQLDAFGVAYEARVLSAHRMPDDMFEYAEDAGPRGLRCIIAGAGGAAHLPGHARRRRPTVPVLGVPVPSKYLRGEDSLLSIVQMPKGIPVATFAIGEAGAANAGLFAVALLAGTDPAVAQQARRVPAEADERRPRDARAAGDLDRRWIPSSLPARGWVCWAAASSAACSAWRRRAWATGSSVLDPGEDGPAGSVADRHIRARLSRSAQALAELAALAGAATTEFENVPAAALAFLARTARVLPGGGKRRDRAGPDPREDLPGASTASPSRPTPCCAREDDARQRRCRRSVPGSSRARASATTARARSASRRATTSRPHGSRWAAMPCVLERLVPLAAEVSVVVARTERRRDVATWPVAENSHRDGILDVSIVPARVPAALAAEARDVATAVADDARLPRRAVRRDVRDARGQAPRQRDRAAPAQQRPLHDRRLRDLAVRAAGARARRPAARRPPGNTSPR